MTKSTVAALQELLDLDARPAWSMQDESSLDYQPPDGRAPVPGAEGLYEAVQNGIRQRGVTCSESVMPGFNGELAERGGVVEAPPRGLCSGTRRHLRQSAHRSQIRLPNRRHVGLAPGLRGCGSDVCSLFDCDAASFCAARRPRPGQFAESSRRLPWPGSCTLSRRRGRTLRRHVVPSPLGSTCSEVALSTTRTSTSSCSAAQAPSIARASGGAPADPKVPSSGTSALVNTCEFLH